jgi:hypothetical protein
LSACNVEAGSQIGLSVTNDGHPLAVVAICKGYLDGVSVYSGSGSKERDDGRWRHADRITSDTTLNLDQPAEGWSTEQPLTLEGSRGYSVYGWTKANRWSATGLDFTRADLPALRAGQVWFEQWNGDDFEMAFVSMTAFHRAAF